MEDNELSITGKPLSWSNRHSFHSTILGDKNKDAAKY